MATNKNLEEEARKNGFRVDLYHRLHQIPIHLPPLRERDGDIRALLDYFLAQAGLTSSNGSTRKTLASISQVLERRQWGGNIREFKAWAEWVWLESGGSLKRVAKLANSDDDDNRRERLLKVLEQTYGNRSEAARILGVSEATIRRWIDKFHIEVR